MAVARGIGILQVAARPRNIVRQIDTTSLAAQQAEGREFVACACHYNVRHSQLLAIVLEDMEAEEKMQLQTSRALPR